MSVAIPASAWLQDWRFDLVGAAAIALGVMYLWAAAGGGVPRSRRLSFLLVGCAPLVVVSCGPVGSYASHLFWVRALQITVLLYIVPLGLAAGTPLTVFGSWLSAHSRTDLRRRAVHLLRSPIARTIAHPAFSSLLLLSAPWLLIFTGLNVAALRHPWLDLLVRCALLAVGFLYFYSRLQADPVPRRFPQSLSLIITIVESLADGVLGIVVWLGPTLYVGYYASLGYTDLGQLQLSQTIGAGMLWLLADLFGLPFLILLVFALRGEDRRRQRCEDAALDSAARDARIDAASGAPSRTGAPAAGTGLWWTTDPELAERFRRR